MDKLMRFGGAEAGRVQANDRVSLHYLKVIPHSTSLLQQRVLVDRVGIRPQKHELSLAVRDDVCES
jgi:hypothetical protein